MIYGIVAAESLEESPLPFAAVSPDAKFGPKPIEWVPLGKIVVLKQVREYYPPEHIRTLADSMEYVGQDGFMHFEMVHQTTVARLDYEASTSYIKEHGAHYGIEHSETDLGEPDGAGMYHLLISGFCRRLAIILNCDRHGLNRKTVPVAMSARDGITFEEALGLQVRENFHMRPSPQEDAHSILRYYQLRTMREGKPPTYATCSRVLGYSTSKIREALKFAQLPRDIQIFAEIQSAGKEPPLSYTTAIRMADLLSAYNAYHTAWLIGARPGVDSHEVVAEAAQMSAESAIAFARTLVTSKTRSAKANLVLLIENKIKELVGAAPYLSVEGLFDMPTRLERRASDSSGKVMARTALWALEYRQSSGEMTSDEEERILVAARSIQSKRQASGQQDGLF